MYSNINWKYIKDISGELVIDDLVAMTRCKISAAYIEMAVSYNGGRPDHHIFITNNDSLSLRRFLRVDSCGEGNILQVYDYVRGIDDALFPFADDSFGNYFCFRTVPSGTHVVFYDHERAKYFKISDSFEAFMASLTT